MSIRSRIGGYVARAGWSRAASLMVSSVVPFAAIPLVLAGALLLAVGVPVAATTSLALGDVFWPLTLLGWVVGNFVAFSYCLEEVWR